MFAVLVFNLFLLIKSNFIYIIYIQILIFIYKKNKEIKRVIGLLKKWHSNSEVILEDLKNISENRLICYF